MKRCPNCSAADLPDSAKVCGHCGTRLPIGAPGDPTSSSFGEVVAELEPAAPVEEQPPTTEQTPTPGPAPPQAARASTQASAPDAVLHPRAPYWAVRVWSAVVLVVGPGSALYWGETIATPRTGVLAGEFALPGGTPLLEYPAILFAGAVAVLVAEVSTARWTRRVAPTVGIVVAMLVASHIVRITTESFDHYRIGLSLGPWVAAACVVGFLIPSRFFRGKPR